MKTRPLIAGLLLSLLIAPLPALGDDGITFITPVKLDADDRVILESFIGHAVDFAEKLDQQTVRDKCLEAPEMFAWIDFPYLDCLNTAYELTGETRYLELLRDRFALYVNILSKGTDDYLGWYGKPIKPRILPDQPDLLIDELQMNFRAISVMARWIELARTNPAYAKAHRKTIDAYLELMGEHLFPKWDARGRFIEVPGRGGVYRGLDFPIEKLTTLSHEKLSIMLDALVKLYRVTGEARYMRRALQVGAWYKSCLSLKDGHYEWMSWAPAGRWDINPDKPDAWTPGWVAPDPNAAWYITSLSIAMNLYRHGLMFSDEDLQRFIRTQKTMCWNGDMDNPVYRNVAGQTGKWVKGRFLSCQLAQYDQTLTKLAFDGPHEADALAQAKKSWQGSVGAKMYVYEKYIMAPVIADDGRPYKAVGQAFLEDPGNRVFYEKLNFEVEAPGAVTPLKPSDMFGND